MDAKETICPWCQTEIVWDPEIGPENECPHCLNELGDYRSIQVKIEPTGQRNRLDGPPDDEFDDDWEDPEDGLEDEWDETDDELDAYGSMVQECIDRQDEAPECTNCRELMLHAGDREITKEQFVPVVPEPLGRPFLQPPFRVRDYVCPSCFRVETRLSETDRLKMIERFKER
jgi:hypothetical protein